MQPRERVRRGPGLLRRNDDFRQLFLADSLSGIGSEFSYLALTLLAVLTLHATPLEVGALQAAATLAFLLIGLPAGAWVDRLAKKPMLLRADLMRAVLFGSIPLAAALDALTLPHLMAVALLAGVATVLFDIAHYAYLPAVVAKADLTEANGLFAATHSVAHVTGPGLTGLVVKVLGAPVAVLVDAITYLASYLFVRRIEAPEPARADPEQRHLRREVAEGMRFLLATPTLRRIALSTAGFNFMGSMEGAVTVLFLARTVGVDAGVIGLLFTVSGAGGVVGALLARRMTVRFGMAFGLRVLPLITTPLTLLIPLTDRGWRLALFCIGFGALSFGVAVFNVAQNSYRQAVVPPQLLGRVSASLRFLSWGSMPIAAIVGGALASAIGPRNTLWIACSGFVLVVLLLLRVSAAEVEAAFSPEESAAEPPTLSR